MSDFLAHDVFIEVLTRLPIKTLVRCACVCKSWYSFLTNPNFITTHLNRSSIANTDNNNNFLLVRSRSGDEADVVHYSLVRSENGMLCDNAELELPLKDPSDRFLRIIGSCNGLVCLVEDFHGYGRSFYLWNPSIRKTITLPPLRVSFQSHGAFMHSVGFGFDARTDDYKVVRIVYLWPPDDFKLPPEIDIFSLSTGTWRNISHLGLQYVIYERAPQAYLNGSAHWLAYNRRREGFCSLIVSFHMGDEIFGEIMVPAGCTIYSGSNARVAKFQESLSLIHGIWGKTCSIWVMKEYGIADSWTKQFNIDTSVGFESVVGFTRKGEVLLGLKSGYLVAYDPDTEQVLHLHIWGTTDRWCMDSFYGDAYTKSLVLLGAKLPNTVTCEEAKKSKKRRAKKSKKRRAKKSKKRRAKFPPLLYPKTSVISCLYLSKKRGAKTKKKGKKRAVIRVGNQNVEAREGDLLKE